VGSNLLGLYLAAAYRFLLIAGATIAVVMLMVGGLEYVISGGSSKRVEKAKHRIRGAIVGLILLFAAYDLAFLISPQTVMFQSLDLANVDAIYLNVPEEGDASITPNPSLTGESLPVIGNHIVNATGNTQINLDPDAGPMLQDAADAFYAATGKNIIVTSADRDLRKQAELFYDNCLAHGGICNVPTCNPASSAVVTKSSGRYTLTGELAGQTNRETVIGGLVNNAVLSNCPHTSKVALDAWCEGVSNFSVDVDCQVKLMQAMSDAGFCRLRSEVWHFEIDAKKVDKSTCSRANTTASYIRSGTTYNPPSTCQRWNFKTHQCVTDKVQ
jgi:hypothetical protein